QRAVAGDHHFRAGSRWVAGRLGRRRACVRRARARDPAGARLRRAGLDDDSEPGPGVRSGIHAHQRVDRFDVRHSRSAYRIQMTSPVEVATSGQRITWRAGSAARRPSVGPVARFVRSSPLGAIAAVVLLVLLFVAIFANQLAPYDPLVADYSVSRSPPTAE